MSVRVALSGKRYSGKTTAAKVFEQFGFRRVSLAATLKAEVAASHGIAVAELERRKEEFRAELRALGQARREADPDYWLKKLEAEIASLPPDSNLVLDDLRFVNEARWLKARGWYLVRLEADPAVRRQRARGDAWDAGADADPSETELDGYAVGPDGWYAKIDTSGSEEAERTYILLVLASILNTEGCRRLRDLACQTRPLALN